MENPSVTIRFQTRHAILSLNWNLLFCVKAKNEHNIDKQNTILILKLMMGTAENDIVSFAIILDEEIKLQKNSLFPLYVHFVLNIHIDSNKV